MSWLFKTLCVLYLSVCVFFQGLAVYVLVPDLGIPAQQTDSARKSAVIVSLGTPLSDASVCCDLQFNHDEQADKENAPVMWEIDTHGSPLHLAHLLLGGIRIASAEHSNYPTPIYSLHRPPDVIS